MIYTSDLTTVL